MITQALPYPFVTEPPFLFSDEVLFTLTAKKNPRRVLLSTGIVLMAHTLRINVPFEVLSLDRTLLAKLQGETFSAHPTIMTAVTDAKALLDTLMGDLTDRLTADFRIQLRSAVEEAPLNDGA